MDTDNNGIIINGLTKQYRGTDEPALKDLTIRIKPGEIYGFLGPNGAGKSTAIRTLLNFLQPTSGGATINGLDIVEDSVEIKKSLGYLSGDMALYPKMTGYKYLSYMAELQSLEDESYKDELIKKLHPDLGKKLGELSRGNKQKVGLVQALMHKPEVIILDEPTTGLDPLMQEIFYDLLQDAKKRKATIFVSSHILSEVQKMCDRVGIIREGTLVDEANIAELAFEATQTFDLEFKTKAPLAKIRKIRGAEVVSNSENTATIHLHGELSDLLSVLAKSDIVRIETKTLDLEEEFMHFYKTESKK